MNKIKIELQDEMSECGLACISMILNSNGINSSLSELRRKFQPDISGLSLYDIENIFLTHNVTSCSYEVDFNSLSQLQLPAIIQWRHQHFVVLSKVSKNHIEVYDPALGRRKYYNKVAQQLFSGYAVNIEEILTSSNTNSEEPHEHTLWGLSKNINGLTYSIVIIGIFMSIIQLFSLLTPKFLSLIADKVINKNDADMLVVISIGFLLLFLFDYLAQSILSIMKGQAIINISNKLSSHSYKLLIKQPVDYFLRRNTTDIVKRLSIVNSYGEHIINNYIPLVVNSIFSVIFLSMVFMISREISMIIFLFSMLYIIIRMGFITKVETLQSAVTSYDTTRNEHINHFCYNIKSNKVNAREMHYLSGLVKFNKSFLNFNQNLTSLKENGHSFFSIINNITTVAIIYFFIKDMFLENPGESSIGNMFLLFFYKEFFFRNITSIIESILEIKRKDPDFKLTIALLNQPCENYSQQVIVDQRINIEEIQLSNASLTYSSFSEPVFENLNFKAITGDKIAIVGKSGRGKTSLASILSSITTLSKGQMYVNNHALEKFGLSHYRSSISVVFSDDTIQNTTVLKNIVQDQHYDNTRLYTVLQSVGLTDEINELYNGLLTLLGQGGVQLSSGQQQRICIARALYKHHDILILDEPTSHLDRDNAQLIYNLINMHEGICIIITHDKDLLNYCNKTYSIEDLI